MALKFSYLYANPEINPVTRKARSIPALNPVNVYGRVFFFSWFAFMIAFWAWYTFPPLLTATIKEDLHLTPSQVANSNIVSLCVTLLVRVVAGPLCDQFGPRKVFGGLLLTGSIPLGLAPLVNSAEGLYASRFFIGILGGAFVPCLVWTTGFFDKNIVGTANALAGGFGTAGGGITYFIMPAVYDSLVARGHSVGRAWRLTFLVPLFMVIVVAIALLSLCPDTPTGPWSERHNVAQENDSCSVDGAAADVPGGITDKLPSNGLKFKGHDEKKKGENETAVSTPVMDDPEAQTIKADMLGTATADGEVVGKPTLSQALRVAFSPQTAFQVLSYMNSFGAELAINAILSSYYFQTFPSLSQTEATGRAAVFGFLDFATRPLGGVVSDLLYKYSGGNLWFKKGWVVLCGLLAGTLLIILGQVRPGDESVVFGLVALVAVFLQAGNGANFALVPHVHPQANGILSGLTGAGGNLGGIIFSVIFRFMGDGTDYAKGFWVIGVIHVAVSLAMSPIPPLPRGQIGGR
ncbi:putative nitrate transporter [Staphylotrichum tortipilum]|uniref:Nitrate/nitrite transporter n=1 Tax=Staphylotrichum tortipilum TaxID=2831512 RepID=A0AAN6MJT2_9PEZI|nr:putative nitrate transporter [Staphylotrichum longicolle]